MKKKVKQLTNYLKYPQKVAKNLNFLENKNTILYKNFFIIPKVKFRVQLSKRYGGKTEYSWIYVSINGKKISGALLFIPEWSLSAGELDYWVSQKITRAINFFNPKASRNKRIAKRIIESFFKVKVKEVK